MTLTNVSLTSSSPEIIYQPASAWTRITDDSGFDAGGSHMLTADPSASASITFNFSSFYLYAPRWPYRVACQITTGTRNFIVDLQDYTVSDLGIDSSASPTVKSSVVFKGGTGEFGTQTIRISVAPGKELAVVDMIIFETVSSTAASLGASTAEPTVASGSPSPSASQTAQTSSKSIVPWIVLTIGIAFLLIAIGIGIFILKRKHKKTEVPREVVDPLSSVGTDSETLDTAQLSSFSQLDSSDTSTLGLGVNSLGQRRVYHSPSASESPAPQFTNAMLTNAYDSSTLSSPSVVAPSFPSQSGHGEGSKRFRLADDHEEAPYDCEPSTSCPPSYSLAVASGSVLSVRSVFDKKYP